MLAPDYARFVTVQNSQFSIHIRFVNNANGFDLFVEFALVV